MTRLLSAALDLGFASGTALPPGDVSHLRLRSSSGMGARSPAADCQRQSSP
ncbi:hypothetical protein GGD62_000736 [Bradyrhizobium sp. ERR14]|nr:hypothetical protein [Bradyrhizobium sp. ERR14]